MNATMRTFVPSALASLLLCAPAMAATVTFHAEPGQKVAGARIGENAGWSGPGELVGFVGDTVELGEGQHELAIILDDGYQLAFTLGVGDQISGVSQVETRPRNCGMEKEVSWASPRVETHGGQVRVLIDDPQFGAELRKGRCMQPLMGGCTEQKLILSVSSQPAGAQVWIDGETQSARTDTTLSVPYCSKDSSKTVLLRHPGFTNCKQVVQELAPDKEVQVHCRLVAVSPPASSTTTAPEAKAAAPEARQDCNLAERIICEATDLCVCEDP